MAYAKSTETRKRLMATTAQLLRTRGYAGTGLSDILEESGLPKGSLYHQFPGGKEALAAAAIERSGEAIVGSLQQLVERAGGAIPAVAAFCDYYVAQLEGSAYRSGCPLATVSLEAAADSDAIHESCSASFAGITDLLTSELGALGISPARARELGVFVVCAIEGALVLAKANRSSQPLTQVRDQLVPMLEAAVEEAL